MITINVGLWLKRLSIAADIVGVWLWLTNKTLGDVLCNPYLKIVIYTGLATLVVFVAPLIHKKQIAVFKKIGYYLLLAVPFAAIIFFFPQNNCAVTPSQLTEVKAAVTDSSIHIISDSQKTEIPRVVKTASPKIHKAPNKQNESVNRNPASSGSNFDLRDAKFYGPTQLGNHDTQINQIPVYHPTNDLFQTIEDSAKSKEREIIVKYPAIPNNRDFASEVVALLRAKGFMNVRLIDGDFEWGFPNRGVEVLNSSSVLVVYVHIY